MCSQVAYATHQTEYEPGSTKIIHSQMHVKLNIPNPYAGSTIHENNKCCTRDKILPSDKDIVVPVLN
jgi:hypothetical protein